MRPVLRISVFVFAFMIFVSQGALAKAVDSALGIGLGKTPGVNSEVALQLHFFQEWPFFRREREAFAVKLR